jgi:hypothetical protein
VHDIPPKSVFYSVFYENRIVPLSYEGFVQNYRSWCDSDFIKGGNEHAYILVVGGVLLFVLVNAECAFLTSVNRRRDFL